METLVLALAAIFYWWFWIAWTDREVAVQRKAGRLLLRIKRRDTAQSRMVAVLGSLVVTALAIYSFPHYFEYSALSNGLTTAMVYMAAPPVYAILLRKVAVGLEIREKGIVRILGKKARLTFTPWHEMHDWHGMPKSGRLVFQFETHEEEYRVAPHQVAEALQLVSQQATWNAAVTIAEQDNKPLVADDGAFMQSQTLPWVGFQFNLRTLLIFALFVAVASGWVGMKLRQARREQQTVAKLAQFAPVIRYRGIFVDKLDFSRSPTKPGDADLACLADLERLGQLDLTGAPVTDAGLKHLRSPKSLRFVLLSGTSVTRAGVQDLKAAVPKVDVAWIDPWRVHAMPRPPAKPHGPLPARVPAPH